jgi:biopolymer transport protein ExbD
MRTLIVSCLVAAAWAVLAVPVQAGGGSAPVKVVLHVSAETKYADVVKILKVLGQERVNGIELEIVEQQAAGVSAVIRARSDTPYKAVVGALEALQVAGVGKVMLSPEP